MLRAENTRTPFRLHPPSRCDRHRSALFRSPCRRRACSPCRSTAMQQRACASRHSRGLGWLSHLHRHRLRHRHRHHPSAFEAGEENAMRTCHCVMLEKSRILNMSQQHQATLGQTYLPRDGAKKRRLPSATHHLHRTPHDAYLPLSRTTQTESVSARSGHSADRRRACSPRAVRGSSAECGGKSSLG